MSGAGATIRKDAWVGMIFGAVGFRSSVWFR